MNQLFKNRNLFFLLVTVLSVVFLTAVSCNEDTASALEIEPRPATGSFLVTGTVNREVSGDASFLINTFNNTTSLEIIIEDDFIDEFQLDFFLTYQGNGRIPGTGTYTIGGEPDNQDVFRAYLSFFGSGFGEGVVFSTDLPDKAGTLVITESSAERISGIFQFEAQTFDLPGNEPAMITVQDGEFSAVNE